MNSLTGYVASLPSPRLLNLPLPFKLPSFPLNAFNSSSFAPFPSNQPILPLLLLFSLLAPLTTKLLAFYLLLASLLLIPRKPIAFVYGPLLLILPEAFSSYQTGLTTLYSLQLPLSLSPLTLILSLDALSWLLVALTAFLLPLLAYLPQPSQLAH